MTKVVYQGFGGDKNMKVRTRFAPSPTGHLHLGGARTALYNWLWAKHCNGSLVLRIEDTDLQRSTEESTQVILQAMQWLNLNYDEGPFYQRNQLEYYRSMADKLITEGKAYRCYCSKEDIDKMRDEQLAHKEKPRYDGRCRDLNLPHTDEHPYVIRFKNPTDGVVEFEDQILGKLSFANAELDDLVIIRSDGSPTYNFSVVVDDCRMGITHVIRGADHVNNTPRQINIIRALGYEVPVYAHVPMILGPDGKLLSKRHGATSVLEYQREGYLPEAIVNYLVRLGWAHGDQEVFNLPELIEYFDVKNIHKAAAIFDPKKLLWLNRHYLKTLPVEDIAERLRKFMSDVNLTQGPTLVQVVLAFRERVNTLVELAAKAQEYYIDQIPYQPKAIALLTTDKLPILETVRNQLSQLNQWSEESLHQLLLIAAEQSAIKLGELAQPIRAAVTGSTVSPPLNTTLALLGPTKTLYRIDSVINTLKTGNKLR